MNLSKVKLTDKFILELKEISTGYLTDADFEKLIFSYEEEFSKYYFTASTEINLARLVFSLFDKAAFLSGCVKYPHYVQITAAIAQYSNYLTDVIVRNPEFLYWLLNTDILNSSVTENYIDTEIKTSTSRFRTFTSKVNYLRTLKRRETLRIGVNDILKNNSLQETTAQLSVLAKGINSALFYLCHNEIELKYGISFKKKRYCLAALGKLGGDELNYSSDIDLILFFDKNTKISRGSSKEYYEILTEAAHLYIQNSTAVTDKGYLFRVDFRLRPDGRNSPLCRTLKDYIQYYESRGEDWERQMLIKMSFVGGNEELYNSFHKYIQHFIYPSSFSVSPLIQIARIKTNIEKKIGETENIKLFSGGIRDIEFSVQALQMLNGGKDPSLRTPNSLEAISLLNENGFLSSDESALLSSAYEFYRRVEHFLQLMNDKQTHLIPDDNEMVEKLAIQLGSVNGNAFRKKLEHTRKNVRNIFESIIGEVSSDEKFSIEDIHFQDKKKSLNNYKYLQTGQGILEQKQFDKLTINAFTKIEKDLLEYLKSSESPDTVLENFARIIRTRPLPSIWYNELTDRKFLFSLLQICEFALRAVEMILTDRGLGDLLLSRKAFTEDFVNTENISISLILFILSIQYSLNIINAPVISNVISKSLSKRISQITAKKNLTYDYFIAAMGSFGAKEMTFSSDVDVIFSAADTDKNISAQEDFQQLLNEFKLELKPFDVDARLRPEGKSSQLVWDTSKYKEYVLKRAEVWELQSLSRIEFVTGSPELYNSFISTVMERINELDQKKVSNDIVEMRKKMDKALNSAPQANYKNYYNIKKSRGGLIDIEYSLQKLLLSDKKLFAECLGKNTIDIVESLRLRLGDKNSAVILSNYSFLKQVEITSQIMFNSNSSVLPLDEKKRTLLAHKLNYHGQREFEQALNEIIKSNKLFFDNINKGDA